VFSSWVLPLLGYSQNVHTLHHLGMWYLIVFTIIHLYMVIARRHLSDETVISTMINGWRVSKK
jgi:Ni/Fe-hydrogenase 1 B-type cytochrome subunit